MFKVQYLHKNNVSMAYFGQSNKVCIVLVAIVTVVAVKLFTRIGIGKNSYMQQFEGQSNGSSIHERKNARTALSFAT